MGGRLGFGAGVVMMSRKLIVTCFAYASLLQGAQARGNGPKTLDEAVIYAVIAVCGAAVFWMMKKSK